MTELKIGKKLKQYRLNHGWSISDVAQELLRRYDLNVSEKTIYGWESDQSFPRTQTFLLLCELYQIEKPYEEFPVVPQSRDFLITAEERVILHKIRKHPELYDVIKRVLDI